MEIASLIIGIVALALAVPTVLQMYFGRPRLAITSDDFTGSEGRILVVSIKNAPVRLLRWLGVEREAGDVTAFIDIQEQGSNRYLERTLPALIESAPMRSIGILGKLLPGFSVGVIVLSTKDGRASIVTAKAEQQTIAISPGHYIAHVDILRGQTSHRVWQAFRVGYQDHETIWAHPGVFRKRR
jgi:hypothetical protein